MLRLNVLCIGVVIVTPCVFRHPRALASGLSYEQVDKQMVDLLLKGT